MLADGKLARRTEPDSMDLFTSLLGGASVARSHIGGPSFRRFACHGSFLVGISSVLVERWR